MDNNNVDRLMALLKDLNDADKQILIDAFSARETPRVREAVPACPEEGH